MRRGFRLLTGACLAAMAIAFYLASSAPRMLTAVDAASVPGTATVTGTVDAPKPFKAAQVYFRNPDRRMLYMVYTVGGRYQAMNLLPGSYEVSVKTKGLQNLESETTKMTVKAGQNSTVNLSLHDSPPSARAGVEAVPFDEIYPAGPGSDAVKRTCVNCHGRNFIPTHHWNEQQWNEALDKMLGVKGTLAQGVMIQPNEMSQQEREAAVKYLVQNFGPSSETRVVKIEKDMPVDESKLAKAEYIEYYFPKDAPGQGVNAPEYAAENGGGRRMGQDVQLDKDGNVWMTDRGKPTRIVKIDPRTGDEKEYLMPNPKAGIHDINIDKNGIVWVPENEAYPRTAQPKLYGFDPKAEKWIYSYDMDPKHVVPEGELIHGHSIDFDSKGNAWIDFIVGNGLAKWDRETKKVSVYTTPTPNSYPYGLVVDKNDNIWIGELHGGKLAKFDVKTSKFTEYTPLSQPNLIRRLAVGSDGLTIWSGSFGTGTFFKLDQITGKMTEWKIPSQISEPYDFIAQGKNIWITDAGQGGALIRFDPDDQSFTYFPSPQIADMPKIRITKDGSIWYCPRSSRDNPGVGVLHTDMTKITTLAAYY